MKTQVMVAAVVLLCLTVSAHAEQINMRAIARIESSLNPLAYNSYTKATGLYQVTPICLKDYNQYHAKKLTLNEMKNPVLCFQVADWYMNTRIPQLLLHYGYEDTIERRLVAYNAGITRVVYYDPPLNLLLPKQTRDYIRKYNEAVKW